MQLQECPLVKLKYLEYNSFLSGPSEEFGTADQNEKRRM